jgi:hypothetical protein
VKAKLKIVTAVGVAIIAAALVMSELLAKSAYRRLSRATEFSSLFVGQPPTASPQALDLNLLIGLPGGTRRHRALVDDGSPAGQLYGLCGLYFLDRKAFEEIKPRYGERSDIVSQTIGCVSVKGSLRSVVFSGGPSSFEESCVSLRLTFGEWLRATFGRLRPR